MSLIRNGCVALTTAGQQKLCCRIFTKESMKNRGEKRGFRRINGSGSVEFVMPAF